MTQLVGSDPVEFEQPEYEVTVPENTRVDHLLRLSARVVATGKCSARMMMCVWGGGDLLLASLS